VGLVLHKSSVGGQAAERLAQLVEEKSDGEIRLRIYQHAALGSAQKQVRGLAEGAIHIFISELWSFQPYARLCGPIDLVYFFPDREHYRSFLSSDLFAEQIYQKLLANGIRLLSTASGWECGSFELLFSTEPLFRPGDLAGRKFRSYASEAAVQQRRALGAEPVIVEWEQIHTAFQEGRIDTVLVPAAHFRSLNIHELAGYATYLDLGYTSNLAVAVSEREYRRFSPKVQRILGEATEEAGRYCTELSRKQSLADLQDLNSVHGIPIIHPVQEDWRLAFTTAIRRICHEGLLGCECYEELQNL
jgi:TRAP-type C4-dicarboxylate transport system substrate-binding protein